MKKPDIQILSVRIDEKVNGVYVDDELLCACLYDEKSDAVRNMIEELTELKDILQYDIGHHQDPAGRLSMDEEDYYTIIDKCTEALKKVGVK